MKSWPNGRAVAARTVLLLAAAAFALPAPASEVLTYTYDGRGRLTKVVRSGSVNNGASECYTYDKANNRTNVTTATAADCLTAGQVSLSISNNGAVSEGTASTFTVWKSGIAPGTVTVNYVTSNGSAAAPGDYTAASGTLTFLVGDTSKTVNVSTVDDATAEAAEGFSMTLSSPVGAAITTGSASGTINDNDACSGLSFSISSNGAVTEGGNSGFTVTMSGPSSISCSVNYATASGSAASGPDFTGTSGILTFAAGQTSQGFSVATIDDTLVEGTEAFSASLSSPTGGALIGTATANATINDNDTCSGVNFTVASNGAVTEGATSTFTITKSGSTVSTCSVNYATAGGTATSGSDFTAASGTLSFSPAQNSQTANVSTIDDAGSESAETFTMSLSGPSGGSVLGSPSSATATINDNDAPPNNPPVANADSMSISMCTSATKNVIANDTDPNGDYPLTLVSVTSGSHAFNSVASSTSVNVDAGGSPGTDNVTYTVRDSRGATSTGTLQIAVFSAQCN